MDKSVEQDESCFKTEERTVQSHNGRPVYVNNKVVEYKIKNTGSKVVLKRHVVSSNVAVVCDDKVVVGLYPDVTNKLLSGILIPRKIKLNTQSKIPVRGMLAEKECERVLVIDKLSQCPDWEDSFKGVCVKFENITEKLVYSSKKCTCFNLLTKVESQVGLELTDKNKEKHHIELLETINLIR